MKFYGLLCVLIAGSLLLTPALALVGAAHEKTAAAASASVTGTEEATTVQSQIEDQER